MALLRVWVVGAQTHRTLYSADRVLIELSVGERGYPVAAWWWLQGKWRRAGR